MLVVYTTPFSKNSTIARILRMIGHADEVGSGFEKIKNICEVFLNQNFNRG